MFKVDTLSRSCFSTTANDPYLANATGAAEMTGITGRECGCPAAGEENAMGAEPTETWHWPPGKARKRAGWAWWGPPRGPRATAPGWMG